MPDAHYCTQCGCALAGGELRGLCARCLLRRGMESHTAGFSDSPMPRRPWQPPAPAELSAQFPDVEVLELIGRGGMGAVYKARQKHLDRIVALKILLPDIGEDREAFADRFTREAKALARLNHPNIVTLYEFGQSEPGSMTPVPGVGEGQGGLYYFLMEFVDGVSLRQLIDAGRISPREALAIVPQVCDALQYAHDHGVVHRDIKPENILLDRQGRVKVADFGLAKIVGQAERVSAAKGQATVHVAAITEAGKVVGTPDYMAPEQLTRPAAVDHRADIYALGVVFYQMLTGELPTAAIEPPSRKVLIDVRLDEVVLRALDADPDRRYSQASIMKTQVETIAADPEFPQRAGPSPARSSSGAGTPRLSRKAMASAILASLFILMLLLTVLASL